MIKCISWFHRMIPSIHNILWHLHHLSLPLSKLWYKAGKTFTSRNLKVKISMCILLEFWAICNTLIITEIPQFCGNLLSQWKVWLNAVPGSEFPSHQIHLSPLSPLLPLSNSYVKIQSAIGKNTIYIQVYPGYISYGYIIPCVTNISLIWSSESGRWIYPSLSGIYIL